MKGKKYSMTKSRIKRIAVVVLTTVLMATSVFSVSAAAKSLEYSASSSYKNSVYYERLMCDGETLFQNGACYEFVKIIKIKTKIINKT